MAIPLNCYAGILNLSPSHGKKYNPSVWSAMTEFKYVRLMTTSFNLDTILTLKHREMHGRVVTTAATDALVLKHQAISIHNAD